MNPAYGIHLCFRHAFKGPIIAYNILFFVKCLSQYFFLNVKDTFLNSKLIFINHWKIYVFSPPKPLCYSAVSETMENNLIDKVDLFGDPMLQERKCWIGSWCPSLFCTGNLHTMVVHIFFENYLLMEATALTSVPTA